MRLLQFGPQSLVSFDTDVCTTQVLSTVLINCIPRNKPAPTVEGKAKIPAKVSLVVDGLRQASFLVGMDYDASGCSGHRPDQALRDVYLCVFHLYISVRRELLIIKLPVLDILSDGSEVQ